MILIGTMNLTRTRDRGSFYCPQCGTTEFYRRRSRRPFLTLYFIPTVPVGAAEEFIQCDGCDATWDLSVLEMDRDSHEAAKEAQFKDEALRSAILTVLIDQQITPGEIDTLISLSNDLLQRPIDREELGQLCSIAVDNRIKPDHYILTVSRRWTQQQRRLALQIVFLAATADEPLDGQRLELLGRLREIFDLTDAEYQATIEEAIEQADAT